MADTDEDKDKVKVTQPPTGKDPQVVFELSTPHGGPFNAKIKIDLVVRDAHDIARSGHAHTHDYVRSSAITIPVNFPDPMEIWNYGVEMGNALLGYGCLITLENEDGTTHGPMLVQGHFSPTNDPPMESDEVFNQHPNDPKPVASRSMESVVDIPSSATNETGLKHAMPHFIKGLKVLFGNA